MRKTFPPQIGQVPWIAGLPFFMVIFWAFWTSTFCLSLTQYASAMERAPPSISVASREPSSRVRRSRACPQGRVPAVRPGQVLLTIHSGEDDEAVEPGLDACRLRCVPGRSLDEVAGRALCV